MQAMAVTATLWPIFFAAVLAPMLKAVAQYRAERGVKLGVNKSREIIDSQEHAYPLLDS